MSTTLRTIGGASTATTDPLPVAVSVDGVNDLLAIYTASATATQAISRNVLLGISSAPLGLTDTQSPKNKTFDNTNTVTLKDTLFILQDDGDTTKQAKFQLSGITTGTTRTYTLPNASSTLADIATAQTLTNKTLTSPTISAPTITNATISADAVTGFSVSNTGTIYGVSIATGVISTANSIAAGTIVQNGVAASQLATSAITLGYAQITTNFNTASTTSVQVTGLTLTVTIPAGGRRIRITGSTSQLYNQTASKNAYMEIWDGVVGSGTRLQGCTNFTVTANTGSGSTIVSVVTPAAGSKTYNIGAFTDGTGGTAGVEAGATNPAFILVEAI